MVGNTHRDGVGRGRPPRRLTTAGALPPAGRGPVLSAGPLGATGSARPEHANLHEPAERLSTAIIERHRALVSLMEELEAVDWYDQRVEASTDDSIRAVMAHNRDEEKEHAAMTLEWLRRNDAKW